MESSSERNTSDAGQAEGHSGDTDGLLDRLDHLSRQASFLSGVTALFIVAIAAYGGFVYGRFASGTRTVERIGDPRMHMSIPVSGGEATAYVHPVRRSSDSVGGVPDITFSLEIPDALAAFPPEAFCGDAPDLTLCGPHLVRIGSDSIAYIVEPDADRLDRIVE
ncbi:MAG: hypothetical protein AAGI91_17770 [Bacteroidota bacterium]